MSCEDDIEWLKAVLKVRDAELELCRLERNQARQEARNGGSKEGCARCSAEVHAAMAAPDGGESITFPGKPTKPVVGPWESDGKVRRRCIGSLEHARTQPSLHAHGVYVYTAWRDYGTRLVTGECATEAEAMAAADQALRNAGLLPTEESVTDPSKPTKPVMADEGLRERLEVLRRRLHEFAGAAFGEEDDSKAGHAYRCAARLLAEELAK